MSSAWSSAATTAPTVSGPISWPPSTSSTSSSTTARAAATRSSSPSIVSWFPRRRSVQWSRERSESSTPSPTPASSAATSFGTETTSCIRLSVGARGNHLAGGLHSVAQAIRIRRMLRQLEAERDAHALIHGGSSARRSRMARSASSSFDENGRYLAVNRYCVRASSATSATSCCRGGSASCRRETTRSTFYLRGDRNRPRGHDHRAAQGWLDRRAALPRDCDPRRRHAGLRRCGRAHCLTHPAR